MIAHDLNAVAFPKLTDEQMAGLERCNAAKLRRFRNGERLFQVGERDFGFFVVKSGKVEIIDDLGDVPKTVTIYGPGNFTGDVAHLTGEAALVSAVARGDCEAYEIGPGGVREIINLHPALGDTILQAFIARRQLLREVWRIRRGSRHRLALLERHLARTRLPNQEPASLHVARSRSQHRRHTAPEAVWSERGRHARGDVGTQADLAQPLGQRARRGARHPPPARAHDI